MIRKITLSLLALIVLVVFLFFRFGRYYYIDYLWYGSQGHAYIWWQLMSMQAKSYIIGVIVALCVYAMHYAFAFWRTRNLNPKANSQNHFVLMGLTFFVSVAINGPLLYNIWDVINIFLRVPQYGLKDPIYNKDASFYMFDLNLYQHMITYFKFTSIISLVISLCLYCLHFYHLSIHTRTQNIKNVLNIALPHICFLVASIVILFSLSTYLSRYSMIYDGGSDRFAGADYVDINARSYTYIISAYLGIIFALAIIAFGFIRNWKLPAIAFGAWVGMYALFLGVYPNIVKLIKVNPNEYVAQKPYLEHSMKYTLAAYNLDQVERIQYPANESFTLSKMSKNKELLDTIRLWDYRTLRPTLKQLQELRQYYEFLDVDVDRYEINEKLKQVMLSVREMNKDNLPTRARTWESRHLQYTHGYGLSMIPANEATKDGQPVLWIKDFPPRTMIPGLPEIKRPEIYYGQMTNDYVLVNTGLKEIDYPLEQKFSETVYSGKGGVKLGSGFRFLLLALEFEPWKFIVSKYIHSETKILYRRNIISMVRNLAPYFVYDNDPYIVINSEGRLVWIIDAYTSSERFPYSVHFDGHYLRVAKSSAEDNLLDNFRNANYVRNSIKVTIDAYDGTVNYYLVDTKDPIAVAWAKTFPKLIRPLSEMPSSLLAHIRYPENLFLIQASIYGDYHMRDALSLYNLEDRWQIPNQIYGTAHQQIRPYYIITKLPGEKKEEFVLMLPYIPSKKENMIAWMAVRNDYRANSKTFGKLFLFDFPNSRQIYGPLQIESRIDQDPEISRDLRLWNQQDSQVLRGDMLVVPIDNSLLYIKPIYLQSTNTPFPELRRVVVADDIGVVMADNLQSALVQLAMQRKDITVGGISNPLIDSLNAKKNISTEQLIRQARNQMQKAQAAVAKGNWVDFGTLMSELSRTLESLEATKATR